MSAFLDALKQRVLLCDGANLDVADLPERVRAPRSPAAPPAVPGPRGPYHEAVAATLEAFDRGYFTDLLRESRGRIGVAAQRAAITPRTLYEKMHRLGLHKEQFRGDVAPPPVSAEDQYQ